MFPNASALFALNGDGNNTTGYTTAMVAGLESFSVSSQEKKWNNDNNALTFNGILACMFHPFLFSLCLQHTWIFHVLYLYLVVIIHYDLF